MKTLSLKFYNTLTAKLQDFVPLNSKEVGIYTCGPTVYSYAHIGNFRAYVFMDVLRRTLKYNGYKLNSVMNITDVGHLTDDSDEGEDKMILAAKGQSKSPYEIANYYTEVFFEDAKKLNIDFEGIKVVKATEHISQMIEFIEGLLKNKYAYEVEGSIYFDVQKYNLDFDNKYGELSKINLQEQLAGARIDINPHKKSPYDFALWIKAPKDHIMRWESPWGEGYPGWHIECSAMSSKYLGPHFDIHTGGIDHIPVHHENEIAQNRGLTCQKDHTQANFWLHCEFLKVDGGKMSKSLGNIYTIAHLEEKGFSALDFRYFLLNANFSKPQNFTWEALEGAKVSRRNLLEGLLKHRQSDNYNVEDLKIKDYQNRFLSYINEDLNIAAALSVVWDMLKLPYNKEVYDSIIYMDAVLGLSLSIEIDKLYKILQKPQDIPQDIKNLAALRWKARLDKNYKKSDELRLELKEKGYSIKDDKEGYEVVKD